MITNFKSNQKTKQPRCCAYHCCGNHFGRIERSIYAKVHSSENRIKPTRRYAKRAERNSIRKLICDELVERQCQQ